MYVVIIHPKSAQDSLDSDVLGIVTRFVSSNIILVLRSDLNNTITLASDSTAKIHQERNNAQHMPQKISKCYCY